MELDRQKVKTVDMRVIKIQELDRYSSGSSETHHGIDSDHPGGIPEGDPGTRGVPKTFMIEIRGDLVNYPCAPGDIVQIMGIVRCIQVINIYGTWLDYSLIICA